MDEAQIIEYMVLWAVRTQRKELNPLNCANCVAEQRGHFSAAQDYIRLSAQMPHFQRVTATWVNAIATHHQAGCVMSFAVNRKAAIPILPKVQKSWIEYAYCYDVLWEEHQAMTHRIVNSLLSRSGRRGLVTIMTFLLCKTWKTYAGQTEGWIGSTPITEVFDLESLESRFRKPADRQVFASYLHSQLLILISSIDFWRMASIERYNKLLEK